MQACVPLGHLTCPWSDATLARSEAHIWPCMQVWNAASLANGVLGWTWSGVSDLIADEQLRLIQVGHLYVQHMNTSASDC